MLKIKHLLPVLPLIFASASHAATIDELVDAQRTSMKYEAQKKTGANQPNSGLQPVMVSPQSGANSKSEKVLDDLRLAAVYGPSGKLSADIYLNGAIYSIKKGGEAIAGWSAVEITNSRVTLRKVTSQAKGKKAGIAQTHVMYLSAPGTNMTTPNTHAGGINSVSSGMPIPLPATGGQVPVVSPQFSN